MSLSLPRFRLVAGLWLLSIVLLGFVSVESSILGLKRWVVDGSMHGAVFLALALVPGFYLRSKFTIAAAALVTFGLAVGLEVAQAVRNGAPLDHADIFANLIGLAAGIVLVVLGRRKVRGAGRDARWWATRRP